MRLRRCIQQPSQAALHLRDLIVGQRFAIISHAAKDNTAMTSYLPVGRCIYCRTTDLPPGLSKFGDEHIIPFALGGDLILPEASCKNCEKLINKEIENPILSQEWGRFRDKRNFSTRHKSARKQRTHTTIRTIDGSPLRINLAEHSTPVIMYKFSEARILCGLPSGFDDKRWTITLLADDAEENAMQAKFPTWDKTHTFIPQPDRFARFLAKIAHSYFVGEYGIEGFSPLVTDIILGKATDYYYLVGGSLDIPPPAAEVIGAHSFTFSPMIINENMRMLARIGIRFFQSNETPIYHVVVAEIDFNNPEHVAVFEQNRLNGKIIVAPPGVV